MPRPSLRGRDIELRNLDADHCLEPVGDEMAEAHKGGDDTSTVFSGVSQDIAHEMHPAALP